MDQVLVYVVLLIWLLPFTFGDKRIRTGDKILDTCLDGIYHKMKPGPESELFSQCTPWRSRSCCTNETAKSLHEKGHYKFNYDHCPGIKNMSSACRRHFIQDTCFYECSPNVGPWLVKVDMIVRKERFFEVPLCVSDCRAWFDACRYDYTCNINWLRGWNWTKEGNQCRVGATCHTFEEMYQTAENFCEKVWDHSWKVTPDEEPCMRLWFNGEVGNPNDAVARYYVRMMAAINSGYLRPGPGLHHLGTLLFGGTGNGNGKWAGHTSEDRTQVNNKGETVMPERSEELKEMTKTEVDEVQKIGRKNQKSAALDKDREKRSNIFTAWLPLLNKRCSR